MSFFMSSAQKHAWHIQAYRKGLKPKVKIPAPFLPTILSFSSVKSTKQRFILKVKQSKRRARRKLYQIQVSFTSKVLRQNVLLLNCSPLVFYLCCMATGHRNQLGLWKQHRKLQRRAWKVTPRTAEIKINNTNICCPAYFSMLYK